MVSALWASGIQNADPGMTGVNGMTTLYQYRGSKSCRCKNQPLIWYVLDAWVVDMLSQVRSQSSHEWGIKGSFTFTRICETIACRIWVIATHTKA